MSKTIFSVNSLSFQYSKKEPLILHDIHCSIEQGDYIGLLGPNGGGKSTFLRLLLGFLSPTKGSIQFHNPKSCKTPSSTIGWVPQHFSFDRSFPISVEDVVLMGRLHFLPWYGQYKKNDYQAVEKALDLVGLLHKKKESFSHLSGGQVQRVLLARALCTDPSILILDEPTANIDTKNQEHIYSLLKELNKQSRTIIMVTHDLHHTTRFFNKIFYLNKTLTPLNNQEPNNIPSLHCCQKNSLKNKI